MNRILIPQFFLFQTLLSFNNTINEENKLCSTLRLGVSTIDLSVVTEEDIKKDFEGFEIVPDVILGCPSLLLNITFEDQVVVLGNLLLPDQVKNFPYVKWPKADPNSFYTLCAVDADSPPKENYVSDSWITWVAGNLEDKDLKKANRLERNNGSEPPPGQEPHNLEWVHWLVVNIPGTNITRGRTLVEYVGMEPILATGFHRHVFLVFKQLKKLVFEERYLSNRFIKERRKFSIFKFAKKYQMGNPIAGNFYLAENVPPKRNKALQSMNYDYEDD